MYEKRIAEYSYEKLIADAEWRIGSYIASGGSSEDAYVKNQIEKIQKWIQEEQKKSQL